MSPSSRRDLLKNVGVGGPRLKALLAQDTVPAVGTTEEAAFDHAKFTPVELDSVLNSSSNDFGRHDLARWFGSVSAADGLLRTSSGRQTFRGILISTRTRGNQQPEFSGLSLSERCLSD